MDKRYFVTVPTCYGVKLARETALRKTVMDSRLYADFRKTNRVDEDRDDFGQRMDKFIRNRNVRIISETITGRVDRDRYQTDVAFIVSWD